VERSGDCQLEGGAVEVPAKGLGGGVFEMTPRRAVARSLANLAPRGVSALRNPMVKGKTIETPASRLCFKCSLIR
jgi:hypothetical protein